MARARNIKPGFFTNDDLAACSPLARILFVGLWTVADRAGRMLDRPRKLKAELLPFDDVDCDELLSELASGGFIDRYEVAGQKVIQVNNFDKHQHPHPSEKESELPCREISRQSREKKRRVSERSLCGSENSLLNQADSLLLNPDTPIPHPESLSPSGSEFPASLQSEEFSLAWTEWLAYRRERSVKTTPRTIKSQIAMLADWGPEVAVQAIQASIRNGWQGLFDPRERRGTVAAGPQMRQLVDIDAMDFGS